MKYRKHIALLIILIIGVAFIYNSVYFEKLDARKQKQLVKQFNPKERVAYFWKNELKGSLKNAIPLATFDSLLQANKTLLIKNYGKTIGISDNYCFLITGSAEIIKNGKEKVVRVTKGNCLYKILTKHIFSNVARDATGFFKVDDFENTMDFNAVSTELNTVIIYDVVNKLNSLTEGTQFRFVGALEVNKEDIPKEIEIVPLEIN